jgi:hypothetical protein
MCGDLEEDDSEAQRLYAGFLHAAHSAIHESIDHRGGSRAALVEQAVSDGGAESDTLSDESLHRYMDGLFGDVLNACIKDARHVGDGDQYRVLAAQAVVAARLAGFLARQLDLRTDPLRTSMEALMSGYAADPDAADHGHHEH